jgi:hypothetical protein
MADTQGSTDNTDNRAPTVPEPATTLPTHPACKQLLRQVKHRCIYTIHLFYFRNFAIVSWMIFLEVVMRLQRGIQALLLLFALRTAKSFQLKTI